jgi:hypothetical protein
LLIYAYRQPGIPILLCPNISAQNAASCIVKRKLIKGEESTSAHKRIEIVSFENGGNWPTGFHHTNGCTENTEEITFHIGRRVTGLGKFLLIGHCLLWAVFQLQK